MVDDNPPGRGNSRGRSDSSKNRRTDPSRSRSRDKKTALALIPVKITQSLKRQANLSDEENVIISTKTKKATLEECLYENDAKYTEFFVLIDFQPDKTDANEKKRINELKLYQILKKIKSSKRL